MESRKIVRNVNVGGELGSAAEDAMRQADIQAESSIPKDAVLINYSMLPSKGIKYNGAKIYITPLTSKNLKDLNSMKEDNANAVLNGVIAERIIGIDHRQILQGDKIWIIFMLRSVTYDDYPVDIKYTCPECKKNEIFKMRMADLPINYLKDDFDFKLKLPQSGDLLTLRFPDIGKETQAERVKNDTQVVEAVDPDLVDVGLYIEAVNGENLTTREAYNYVKEMKALDFSKFTNFMIDNNIGIKPVIEIQCDCGAIVKQRIGFTPDFFMPKF